MGCFTPSLDKIKSFLKLNSIDPDELFNELEPLDLKQGVCKISRIYAKNGSPKQVVISSYNHK